jgi:ATP-dependent DNA ligase
MLNKPIKPLLLQPSPEVITKPWVHSLKWDGWRILIHYENGKVRAFTREGNEVTWSLPELQRIKMPVVNAIIDGECICLDQNSNPPKPCWDDAITRLNAKKEIIVNRYALTMPVHFPVWDVLWVNDEPLLKRSFVERREVLESIVTTTEVISVTPLYEDGGGLFRRAKELGLEGIVSYNPDSFYCLDSRPKNVWVKTKAYQYAIVQITCVRKGEFGWGISIDGNNVGLVEFPPAAPIRKRIYNIVKKHIRSENSEWIFLNPAIYCKVKFQCFTKGGKMRSPTVEGFL